MGIKHTKEQTSQKAKISKTKVILFITSFLAISVLGVFLIVEGIASLLLFSKDFYPMAERKHTQYDELLGWSNIPNTKVEGIYGKNTYLQTNSQGFRAEYDYTQTVPSDKQRIICSGDSFTLGYGVSNDQTWCHQLSQINPDFETINMGQGGYGIGQAYLWYKRDGITFDHQYHIFAFISADIERALHDTFLSYDKPIITLQDGRLIPQNTPVPTFSYEHPFNILMSKAIGNLRISQLTREFSRLFAETKITTPHYETRAAVPMIDQLFKDLKDINMQKNSKLIIVYIPTKEEYTVTDITRELLGQHLQSQNYNWLDLTPHFNKLNSEEISSMYHNHFTPAGNLFVARQIDEYLTTLKESDTNPEDTSSPN